MKIALVFQCIKDMFCFSGDLDGEEPDFVYAARQKLAGLSSCFAQLTHKAQTIFQNSAKIEVSISYNIIKSIQRSFWVQCRS